MEKVYIRDLYSPLYPKSPSPRNPIDKGIHGHIYNQGWNDCMAFLKAVGKI